MASAENLAAEQAVIDAWKKTACHTECKALCDEFSRAADNSNDNSRNVQYMDRLMGILGKYGDLEEDVWLHCKSVGPLPSNRRGEGLLWSRAQSRAAKIKQSGHSLTAWTNNAVAVAESPFTNEIGEFTVKITSTSEHFAKYEVSDVKAGALGATHATHGFAQVFDQVPCTSHDNISTDGRISRAKVFDNDPSYEKAVMVGSPYKLIKWVVRKALPKAIEIISDALNTIHQISEGESFTQNLLSIAAEAGAYGPGQKIGIT